MNARALILIVAALSLPACTSAAPNPTPIDAGTAHAVAMNDNLACETGTCGVHNSTVDEITNSTSSSAPDTPYSSGAISSLNLGTWTPLSYFAAGALALSTGML